MHRSARFLGFFIIVAALLVACGNEDDDTTTPQTGNNSGGEISVIATTAQIGALVHEVAGEQVAVYTLMQPGVDPHDFETTPGDLRAISEADLILQNGIGLDDFLESNIEAAGGDAPIVTVTDGVTLLAGGHDHGHDGDDHDHDHGDFDPHVWQDPANAKIMVDNIVAALSEVDADNAASYEENGAAYKAVLDDTDAEIRALVDEIPEDNRKLVTTHDALGYFIHAYGFEFVGAIIPSVSTGAEPSARDIADLSETIRDEDLKAIFAEETVDPRVAEQLASDTGVEIVYGLHSDSLGEPGSGAETIHGMLLANATLISEALK